MRFSDGLGGVTVSWDESVDVVSSDTVSTEEVSETSEEISSEVFFSDVMVELVFSGSSDAEESADSEMVTESGTEVS